MKLRGGSDGAAPAGQADGLAVEAAQEQQAGIRSAQPGDDGSEGGFATAGGAFEKDAIAGMDVETAFAQDGQAAIAVGEVEVVGLEEGRFLLLFLLLVLVLGRGR